jgi:hypothetical protein
MEREAWRRKDRKLVNILLPSSHVTLSKVRGLLDIFLRVDRSINEIQKPRVLNTIEIFYIIYRSIDM